jgi:hypothetical protein
MWRHRCYWTREIAELVDELVVSVWLQLEVAVALANRLERTTLETVAENFLKRRWWLMD